MSREKAEISSLTGHLGFWMRRVSNHVSYNFARRLKSRGATVAEWVVLRDALFLPSGEMVLGLESGHGVLVARRN